MLKLYEEIGKVLGPEEIGAKILPGVIPMLVSGHFTKHEFKDMMSSVHRLLDQIEQYRMPSLPDESAAPQNTAPQAQDSGFPGLAGSSATTP